VRFNNYLTELASEYGKGITFIDIDESIFRTFAKINVLKNGKVVKKLDNQQFNTYELKDGEEFEFHEFRSAEIFRKTSIPIPQTINRIKRMFKNIEARGSKVILLTARADFDDKDGFLAKFREYGIPIDKIYVERIGNFIENPDAYKRIIKNQGMPKGTSGKKKAVVMDYLKSGEYRRVRLIDDDMKNVKDFISIEQDIPDSIINKVKKKYNIPDDEDFPVIQFFGLLVQQDGSLRRIQ